MNAAHLVNRPHISSKIVYLLHIICKCILSTLWFLMCIKSIAAEIIPGPILISWDEVLWKLMFCLNLGIQQLLTIAGTIPEHKTISVTQNSRMHVSLCLSKIYEDLISDQERDLFSEATEAYFTWVVSMIAETPMFSGTMKVQISLEFITA